MDTVDTALLNAVGALLLAEAGGVGGQGLGQLVLRQDLVDELADHGVLAGADQVEVFALDLIHHGVHVGLAHNALHHVAVDHEGGDAVGEALVDHEVPAVGQHRLVEPCNVAQQIVETAAGHAACRVQINAVKPLHDVGVIGYLEIRGLGLAEALHLHVAAVVGADGHGVIDDLGDHQHDLVQGGFGLGLLGFQLGHAVGVRFDGGVVGVDLGLDGGLLRLVGALFQLAEQGTVGLGQLVALGLQGLTVVDGLAALGIQGNGLVHQGQLGVLELLADIFLDNVGVFPNKFDIKHNAYLFIDWIVSRETSTSSTDAGRPAGR